MKQSSAKRAARHTLQSGYRHHGQEDVQRLMVMALEKRIASPWGSGISLETYADVLAPTPFRAMQNGVICLVTMICRLAIDMGVATEQSFALSDFYVCEVENQYTKKQLESLVDELLANYADLVQEAREDGHTLPVARAVRYIHNHLYEPLTVATVAAQVQLHPAYFSALFKKETGQPPSRYIHQKKMQEACTLLRQANTSVGEVAEALGYCSAAYFCAEFKRIYKTSPLQYAKGL